MQPRTGTCPFCGSSDVELLSLFGSQLLTAQYYCNSCKTPFERVKSDEVIEEARASAPTDTAGRE